MLLYGGDTGADTGTEREGRYRGPGPARPMQAVNANSPAPKAIRHLKQSGDAKSPAPKTVRQRKQSENFYIMTHCKSGVCARLISRPHLQLRRRKCSWACLLPRLQLRRSMCSRACHLPRLQVRRSRRSRVCLLPRLQLRRSKCSKSLSQAWLPMPAVAPNAANQSPALEVAMVHQTSACAKGALE